MYACIIYLFIFHTHPMYNGPDDNFLWKNKMVFTIDKSKTKL
jgi:hypothetical protein